MDPIQRRLHQEYKDMCELRDKCRGMFEFEVSEDYRLYDIKLIGIETLVGTTEEDMRMSNYHEFSVKVPLNPKLENPNIKFKEPIFHPNWYKRGKVCYGGQLTMDDRISELVIDIVNMMQYKIVNLDNPTDHGDAKRWYERNRDNIKSIIPQIQFPPSDTSELEFYDNDDELEFY